MDEPNRTPLAENVKFGGEDMAFGFELARPLTEASNRFDPQTGDARGAKDKYLDSKNKAVLVCCRPNWSDQFERL